MTPPLADKACTVCCAAFRPKRRDKQYCSRKCKSAAWSAFQRERRRAVLTDRACAHCDAAFRPRQQNTRYCSKTCGNAAWYASQLERNRAHHRTYYRANRETVNAKAKQRRLERVLMDTPDDPFVRQIMAAIFEIRSKAIRETHAHLRKQAVTR